MFYRRFSSYLNAVSLRGALALVTLGFLATSAHAESLPDLTPETLSKISKHAAENKNGAKFTMLDFFSQYCGVCQQMEPFLKALQKELGSDVRFLRVDADKKDSVSARYKIEGTPTYILFDAQGKPVYRMEGAAMDVLFTQLLRFTGKIPQRELPPKLLPQTFASSYTLIAIHPKDCQPCEAKVPYLNAMSFATEQQNEGKKPGSGEGKKPVSLTLAVWDPADAETLQYLKKYEWPQGQGYVLLDPSHRALLQARGNVDPQELWKNIRLLSDDGL